MTIFSILIPSRLTMTLNLFIHMQDTRQVDAHRLSEKSELMESKGEKMDV